MAKAARPGTKPPGEAGAKEIVVVVGGVRYPLAFDAISARLAGECRRACGMSPRELVENLRKSPDIDLVAALVWLSRRLNGDPKVTYDEIADEIGYDTELDFVDPDGEQDDSPEA